MRAGQRDEAVATDFAEPFATNFGAVAPPFDQVGAGQQFAQLLVAGPVARQQQQTTSIVG